MSDITYIHKVTTIQERRVHFDSRINWSEEAERSARGIARRSERRKRRLERKMKRKTGRAVRMSAADVEELQRMRDAEEETQELLRMRQAMGFLESNIHKQTFMKAWYDTRGVLTEDDICWFRISLTLLMNALGAPVVEDSIEKKLEWLHGVAAPNVQSNDHLPSGKMTFRTAFLICKIGYREYFGPENHPKSPPLGPESLDQQRFERSALFKRMFRDAVHNNQHVLTKYQSKIFRYFLHQVFIKFRAQKDLTLEEMLDWYMDTANIVDSYEILRAGSGNIVSLVDTFSQTLGYQEYFCYSNSEQRMPFELESGSIFSLLHSFQSFGVGGSEDRPSSEICIATGTELPSDTGGPHGHAQNDAGNRGIAVYTISEGWTKPRVVHKKHTIKYPKFSETNHR